MSDRAHCRRRVGLLGLCIAILFAASAPTHAGDQGNWVYCVRFSPDGKQVLSAGAKRKVQLWDVETGRELHAFDHPGWQQTVTFSPDGRYGLSGVRGWNMRLWDLTAGKLAREFKTGGAVHCALFPPDGKSALSIGRGKAGIKVWDVETGRMIREFIPPEDRTDWGDGHGWGALSKDGKILVTCSGKAAIVWDVETGKAARTLRGHPGLVWTLALSPDGETCITGGLDKTLIVWRVKDGKLLKRVQWKADVRGLAISADGKLFAAGRHDGKVVVGNLSPFRPTRVIQGHRFIVESVDFSPNGKLLVSGSFDRTIKLWNARTGRLVRIIVDGK